LFYSNDAVHADLTPIIAVHKKDLLRAYLANNVINAVEDEYFLKSVVYSTRLQYNESKSVPPSTSAKESKGKITCPVCPYTWEATIMKKNVKAHLDKYHSHLLKDDCVVKFLEEKFSNSKV